MYDACVSKQYICQNSRNSGSLCVSAVESLTKKNTVTNAIQENILLTWSNFIVILQLAIVISLIQWKLSENFYNKVLIFMIAMTFMR